MKLKQGHRTMFVAGWRPFIGWVIGVALLYNFILRDLIIFAHPEWSDLPALQMDELFTILIRNVRIGRNENLGKETRTYKITLLKRPLFLKV